LTIIRPQWLALNSPRVDCRSTFSCAFCLLPRLNDSIRRLVSCPSVSAGQALAEDAIKPAKHAIAAGYLVLNVGSMSAGTKLGKHVFNCSVRGRRVPTRLPNVFIGRRPVQTVLRGRRAVAPAPWSWTRPHGPGR